MAYLYTAGFERSLADEGGVTAGTVTIDAAHAYTGGSGLVLDKPASATDTSFLISYHTTSPFSPSSPHMGTGKRTLSMSVRLKVITAPSSSSYSLILSANTYSTGLNFDILLNNGVNLAISSESGHASPTVVASGLTVGQWYLLEWRVNASANPHTLDVRVNGGASTGITIAQAAEDSRGICLGQKLGAALDTISWKIAYDDLVMTDSTAFIGEHRVRLLTPDAGAADLDTNWTITGGGANRMDATDDNPSTTGTLITSSTSGQTQRLEMLTYPLTPTCVVKCLDLRGYADGTSTTGTFTATLQSGAGTDGSASTWTYASGTYRVQPYQAAAAIFENVPGGTGWSQANLDAARAKITKDANTNAVNVADVWAYATFTGDQPAAGAWPSDHMMRGVARTVMPAWRGPRVESVFPISDAIGR